MESIASDKPVQREIRSLLSDERLFLRETQRAVTPFGGLAIFVSFRYGCGWLSMIAVGYPARFQ